MRILHIVTALDFGGVETRMRILARAYATYQKDDVGFLAIGGGGAAEADIRSLGLHVNCLRAAPTVYSVRSFLGVLIELRAARPDVVHTHGAEANFHGLLAARLLGVPVRVGEEIGVADHSAIGRVLFKFVFRFASKVVAISDVVRDNLLLAGEAKTGQVSVVENPVRELRPVPVEERSSASLRVIYVGRLVDWKCVNNAIAAVATLRERGHDIEFWVVGEGKERIDLENQAHSSGIETSVQFRGYQDRPEDFVAACDLFVLPSTEREGFCMSLVEAMAIGVPALSTAVGIAPKIIRDGETGWLVPPNNPLALAEKLEHICLLPPDRRLEIGDAARRFVTERSSARSYVAKLDALYAQLFSKSADS